MDSTLEILTTNEAAVVAGVSVDDVNRAIDRKILPISLYRTTATRTVSRDACLWIAFWFETADLLTSAARQRLISEGSSRCPTWVELRTCKLQESRAIEVGFQGLWDEVNGRLNELGRAQDMVIEDPEILSGTPVIRGTRIPVYDVASLIEADTTSVELKDLYPRLSEEQFKLAQVYAKARPLRGRPKRRSLPESRRISVSKKHLRETSV
ncbi:protein of unknown function DUF433 [Granulicella tundricola MP5ACTX9]|uniref:DUF433 domain-containing protein n=1 Tax=Granulicella tundricola (strain ATCC BAA-1859 / DSM 23138 / MP5ACTX9) TaxID=1198114 RepID=E8X0T7_GRATM|nr:protein of unknown function DUF433 [Granulicella tundricola MP5ACTX9]